MGVAKHAIILAAGRGARMGEMTATKPKCLAVLAGKSLLEWQLAALRSAGIQSITVIGGYRKDLLHADGYQLLDNPDWASTNMLATLRCASALLREHSCVVSYADILYRPDRAEAVAAVDADIAISYDTQWEGLWRARFAHPLADAETFRQENGWLTAIGERTRRMADIEGQYLGLLKFTPPGWSRVEQALSTLPLERQRSMDMTSLLRVLLSGGTNIRCVPGSGAWCEVDNSADLHLYQRLLSDNDRDGTRWDHDWRW
jgi:choline kinase